MFFVAVAKQAIAASQAYPARGTHQAVLGMRQVKLNLR
jgi:hypothetical protein